MNKPLHEVIADDLRRQIVSGSLAPGARVPSEKSLAASRGVSRNTVRQALRTLETAGLVSRGAGPLGRTVQERKLVEFHATRSEGRARGARRRVRGVDAWVADNLDQGRVGTQVIVVEVINAPADIAARLDVPVGAAVVVRRRLRYSDGEPNNQNDTYFPEDLVRGTAITLPADVPQGAIELLAEMGHPQVRWRDRLEARAPTPQEARALEIAPGFPVIVHIRTGYGPYRPIRVAETVWRGDRAAIIYEGEDPWPHRIAGSLAE